ncbi:uncharacterized protein EI90DRAFT_3119321 [Cantharellus anzutake]|uniref:uncharacterized protein n=1 Tax=Cantharellus anzutake TaxID=1750568 RepID=UPI001905ECD5|nr:uncharacterized protein EI90DRAFT_3119321 [Cantharellus anzutake]KAF8336992.1 hypothetical protein EI90DRAFT_3119321 [Cantharellus anzutake]
MSENDSDTGQRVLVNATPSPPATWPQNWDKSPTTSQLDPTAPNKTPAVTTTRATITPTPGPICTPYDSQIDYNVLPLPPNFTYKVRGMTSALLHTNVSERGQQAWNNTDDHAVIIVPLYMSYTIPKRQEARTEVEIFIERAFPASGPTLDIIPAARVGNTNGYEPHPWGIMVAGLQAQDAATLLFHQFWLSKKISFAAYPATPFTSEWLGNWAIVVGEKQKTKVLQCLKETLSLPNSVIGHYLLCTVPDSNECLEIVNSARVEPINVTRGTTTTIHWIFLAKSPHPSDTEKHQKWVNAAEATECQGHVRG